MVSRTSPPTTPLAAHPLLGQPARVELHRYRPAQTRSLTGSEEVGPYVAALGAEHTESTTVPRTMPAAEVTYFDAAGAAIATVVFLSAEDRGMVSAGSRGTWALTADESAALRALLARHLP